MEKTSIEGVSLRPATPDDVPVLLGLMDIATLWLTDKGLSGQWGDGSSPHSSNPARLKQGAELVESGGTWVAIGSVPPPGSPAALNPTELTSEGGQDQIIGAVTVHTAFPHIPPVEEPERYVRFLITHRSWKGRGLGTMLVDKARALAVAAGVGLLRVDCYAGGNGQLVRWYESQGFVKSATFVGKEGTWPGQVLEMRL